MLLKAVSKVLFPGSLGPWFLFSCLNILFFFPFVDVTGSHEYRGPRGGGICAPLNLLFMVARWCHRPPAQASKQALPVLGLGTLQYSEPHLHHASSWDLVAGTAVQSPVTHSETPCILTKVTQQGKARVSAWKSPPVLPAYWEYQKPFKSCSLR